MLKNPVRHALRNLTNFSGRDDRKSFWIYAAAIAGTYGFSFGLVMMLTMAEVASSLESSDAMFPSLHGPMLANSILCVICIVLLAAAVARRLHDTGFRAIWGILPLPFLLCGVVLMPQLFDGFLTDAEPDMSLFLLIFLNNFVYVAALGLLISLLARSGDSESNRFGPPQSHHTI